jgi:GxxExxY protein
MKENETTRTVIGCAMDVHSALGPGLLESVYEKCLAHEFRLRDIEFERQKVVPIEYKGARFDTDLRVDFLVRQSIVVELESVDHVLPVHEAQLLSYLKLTKCRVGLIINFNVVSLRHGIHRRIREI